MKTFAILLLAMFLAFTVQLPAQLVITFTTQQQIDDFHSNYPGITQLNSSVIIGTWNNCNINNLNGLSGLESIEGFLQIEYTTLLEDFTGLETLSCIDSSLIIQQNPGLESLTGLDGLQWIGWNLKIENNDRLTDFLGLGSLMHLGNSMQINSNDDLESFSGFGPVKFFHDLEVQFNNSLTSLSGLDSLNKFFDFVSIEYNDALVDLNGLGACTLIAGNLKIENNQNLSSLNGLASLEKIGKGMTLFTNNSLDSLIGLKSLRILSGSISINNNHLLSSLIGLDSIVPDSVKNLYIKNNPHLSECNVTSMCAYISETNSGAVIEIQNNAPGCNSKDEVKAACEAVWVEEIAGEENIEVYPNPSSFYVIISNCRHQSGQLSCVITDVKGQIVFSGRSDKITHQFLIDVAGWPVGLYFCKIFAGPEMISKKIIKQ